jgi:hypothetical protein
MRRYSKDPVRPLIEQIRPLWRTAKFPVSFPLFLKCGRIKK